MIRSCWLGQPEITVKRSLGHFHHEENLHMRFFKEKDRAVDYAKIDVLGQLGGTHPTDEAKVYREIETWAGERARLQEECNERDGVPERSCT